MNKNQGLLELNTFQVFVNNIKNKNSRIAKNCNVHYAKWIPFYMTEKWDINIVNFVNI